MLKCVCVCVLFLFRQRFVLVAIKFNTFSMIRFSMSICKIQYVARMFSYGLGLDYVFSYLNKYLSSSFDFFGISLLCGGSTPPIFPSLV